MTDTRDKEQDKGSNFEVERQSGGSGTTAPGSNPNPPQQIELRITTPPETTKPVPEVIEVKSREGTCEAKFTV